IEMPKIYAVVGHGIKGDKHAGVREMDARERELRLFGFREGHDIANLREFSSVSVEELETIGENLALPAAIPFGCLTENLVIRGIPNLSQLPRGTLLFFRRDTQRVRTAVLSVWNENGPCGGPGEVLQERFPDQPNLPSLFQNAAKGLRGVVGFVYVTGYIKPGDEVIAMIPHQRLYLPT
ncbi:MAG: hypothetical protein Q8O98_01115, partial [bacterium]|nr:hypothetical protein [bacterium]